MKKVLVLFCLVMFVIAAVTVEAAVTIEPPKIDITGLFLKATSTFMTIVRAVVKEVLAAISNAL